MLRQLAKVAAGASCPAWGLHQAACTACRWFSAGDGGVHAASSVAGTAEANRSLQTVAANPGQGWELEARAARIDPFNLVSEEVQVVSERLRHSVVSTIPVLARAAKYFFQQGVEGKRLRPSLVLLMASALSPHHLQPEHLTVDLRPPHERPMEVRRQQQRIAEIAELIHVASLLHDDVLDDAETRRGILSLNASAGNKVAILAGDFLLARASVSLASLHNTDIVVLLSQVLEDLVAGEIMQSSASADQLTSLDHYLQKTYFKTASLMANSSQAVANLGGQPPEVCALAWNFGRHLGLAFQIVDDVLDLTATSSVLGKPSCNDMKSGIATAPVLLAAQKEPTLLPIIRRKFKNSDDIPRAMELVELAGGIGQARELARYHARLAADIISQLPESQSPLSLDSRAGLIRITQKVLNRTK